MSTATGRQATEHQVDEPRRTQAAPALELIDVDKSFSDKPALAKACFTLRSGEVHALVGQNGCGKSTLIKVLAGYHSPDGGTARVHGMPIVLGDRKAAHTAGIRFIHQDLGLVGDLSTVDNLALGQRYEGRMWLSDRRERAAARRELARYDVDIDVDVAVKTLSPARQTFVAIVRSLRSGLGERNVLVLDEPTAALPEAEVNHLFTMLRRLRDAGVSIVLVTHRLTEVLELADRVTVLRDGSTVVTRDVAGLDHDSLAELIIGRPMAAFYPTSATPAEIPALEVRDVAGRTMDHVGFTVYRGEMLGIAGIAGSGYDEVLGVVFGVVPRTSGQVLLEGRELGASPAASIRAGLVFAPADRKRLGAVAAWTLRENVTLPGVRTYVRGWLGERAERVDARGWLEHFQVAAASERQFSTLSGGNQQRVVLAKWLRLEAKVMLLDEPTNGVDIGARHAIYEAMSRATETGTSFVLASSDAEELAAVCDRVLVMRHGRIATSLSGTQLTVDAVVSESLRAADVKELAR